MPDDPEDETDAFTHQKPLEDQTTLMTILKYVIVLMDATVSWWRGKFSDTTDDPDNASAAAAADDANRQRQMNTLMEQSNDDGACKHL